jgi:hypothetical protein
MEPESEPEPKLFITFPQHCIEPKERQQKKQVLKMFYFDTFTKIFPFLNIIQYYIVCDFRCLEFAGKLMGQPLYFCEHHGTFCAGSKVIL